MATTFPSPWENYLGERKKKEKEKRKGKEKKAPILKSSNFEKPSSLLKWNHSNDIHFPDL